MVGAPEACVLRTIPDCIFNHIVTLGNMGTQRGGFLQPLEKRAGRRPLPHLPKPQGTQETGCPEQSARQHTPGARVPLLLTLPQAPLLSPQQPCSLLRCTSISKDGTPPFTH